MTIFREQKLGISFFFAVTTLCLNSISSSAALEEIHYADHCASVVPESTLITAQTYRRYVFLHSGYYTSDVTSNTLAPNSPYGRNQVPNSVEFLTFSVRNTEVQGLLKVTAYLRFPNASTYNYLGNFTISSNYRSPSFLADRRRTVTYRLRGFWSESSGRLCMVGYGHRYTRQGTALSQPAILKLYNFINSTTITSLISGTLESLIPSSQNIKDPNYFDPISILMLPRMNYQYTLASNNSNDHISSSESDDHNSSLQVGRFCSQLSTVVLQQEFDLQYSSQCVSATNCTPFSVFDHLPRLVSFKDVECLEYTRSLRVMVEFTYSSDHWHQKPFNPNTTLVAEGSWDAKNNRVHFVACHFLEAATGSFNNSHVGNCSTRLSLKFPAIWTIGNTSSVVGQIWSNKSKTESGYFERITFKTRQSDAGRVIIPGPKYEYTKLDQVTMLCPRKKPAAKNHKTNLYPSPFSYDMRFDMSARSSEGLVAWGSSEPLSVGNQFYEQYLSSYTTPAAINEDSKEKPLSSTAMISTTNHGNPTNISYIIRIRLLERSGGNLNNTMHMGKMQISAEGIYDDTDGSLCMIGCRNVGLNSNQQTTKESADCEILVKVHFPPTQQSNMTDFIKVTIESTRTKSDPLHFKRLDLSSASGYMIEAQRTIRRMDMEIILVLISTTLSGVFVALQLLHVKKHPEVLPSISIVMQLVLTLGYLVPLMLNFDDMFTHNTNRRHMLFGSGGWLEVDDVIVRVMTMVAFLLQFHLLQQTWSARSVNGKQRELWDMEKVTLPCYIIGIYGAMDNLKSYAGLLLDGFLLPQIVLNVRCKSREHTLSNTFYIGTTLVRVLPHVYDLYRTYISVHRQIDESYIYASPVTEFYTTAWDVIIPIGGPLFAVIIFLQQKFGGRCLLPQTSRELGSYEDVPTVSEA